MWLYVKLYFNALSSGVRNFFPGWDTGIRPWVCILIAAITVLTSRDLRNLLLFNRWSMRAAKSLDKAD